MHINLKSKDQRKVSARASELEKEREIHIEPSGHSGVKMSSISDVGLDITKGRGSAIESVKTGAPINVSKIMDLVDDGRS